MELALHDKFVSINTYIHKIIKIQQKICLVLLCHKFSVYKRYSYTPTPHNPLKNVFVYKNINLKIKCNLLGHCMQPDLLGA